MTIKEWAAEERPREKLLRRGAQSLSDAELLAIFLRTGVAGSTAVDLAREVLQRFDGLANLLRAERGAFCETRGLGVAKYVQLKAVLELARRHFEARAGAGDVLTSPAATRAFLRARLQDYPYEVFACLFLDNRHRLIRFEELFRGTIDGASVHPREVVRQALAHNAAALILAHNHPSGVAEPSGADRQITRRLVDALALVDVRVLDHLVVGRGEAFSFAEQGLL